MNLSALVEKTGMAVICGKDLLDRAVTAGYASDLLSDVLAHGADGAVWITLQVHANTVAVAAARGIAAIIIVNNRDIPDETITRAESESVVILRTGLSTYELAGRLYGMGIPGAADDAA